MGDSFVNITVFTATYNRGYILPKLYQSLKRQTYRSFEWIIIDDGSTDNTEILVSKWKNAGNFFDIRYIKTINGGKHRAINKGVKLARGILFFIVDSDDYLTDNALERISYWENTINSKSSFAGICGNKMYFNGELMGKTFCGQTIDCKMHERKKYGIVGEKAEVFYVHILKKYPFPEFENENFLSEAVVWNRISVDGYKLRFFNESIYFSEYRDDGLTCNIKEKMKKNINGTLLFFKEMFFLQNNTLDRFRIGSLYIYYGLKNGMNFKEIRTNLNISKIMLFLLIIAYFGRLIQRK